jgi:hypothetical protein
MLDKLPAPIPRAKKQKAALLTRSGWGTSAPASCFTCRSSEGKVDVCDHFFVDGATFSHSIWVITKVSRAPSSPN